MVDNTLLSCPKQPLKIINLIETTEANLKTLATQTFMKLIGILSFPV